MLPGLAIGLEASHEVASPAYSKPPAVVRGDSARRRRRRRRVRLLTQRDAEIRDLHQEVDRIARRVSEHFARSKWPRTPFRRHAT